MSEDFPIALFVSYHGSTADAVVRSSLDGDLKRAGVHVDLVVSSSPNVDAIRVVDGIEGMKHGAKLKLSDWRVKILDPRSGAFENEEAYGEAILSLCERWKIKLICLFGWLGPLPKNVLDEYGGRILRQFCGPMDPGRRDFFSPNLVGPGVHAAVLYYNRVLAGINGINPEPTTEAVAQLILRPGDDNPVVGETSITILPDDNPTTLAERALKLEHKLQVYTILKAKDGKLVPRIRPQPLIPRRFNAVLDEAMAIGRTLYPVRRHKLTPRIRVASTG